MFLFSRQVSLETPQFLSSMGPSIDGVTINTDWQQQMAKMGKQITSLTIIYIIQTLNNLVDFTNHPIIFLDMFHRIPQEKKAELLWIF